MAFIQDTNARTGEVRIAETAGSFASGLAGRIARYRLYRRTLNELSALSDRDLADLGIHRSQISEIARQAAV